MSAIGHRGDCATRSRLIRRAGYGACVTVLNGVPGAVSLFAKFEPLEVDAVEPALDGLDEGLAML